MVMNVLSSSITSKTAQVTKPTNNAMRFKHHTLLDSRSTVSHRTPESAHISLTQDPDKKCDFEALRPEKNRPFSGHFGSKPGYRTVALPGHPWSKLTKAGDHPDKFKIGACVFR